MDAKDVVTMIAALVGMGLGIYNFFRSLIAEGVRLRVIPKASSFQGRGARGEELYLRNRDRYDVSDPLSAPDTLSLEVINLSKYPVTIDEVGLKRRWTRRRIALAVPIVRDNGAWPRKLEARESVTVDFDATRLLDLKDIGLIRSAYASTVCGATRYGASGALKEFVRIAAGRAVKRHPDW